MNDPVKLKEDLKAVMAEIKGKSDKGMFTLRRVSTAVDRLLKELDEAQRDTRDAQTHALFLLSKISKLEQKIEDLKSELKRR